MAIQTGRQNGVVLPNGAIANQHEPQVLARKPCFTECDVLGDRIILAIASSGCKRRKRRGPPVGLAMLGEIACITDRHVDAAVDLL